MFSTIFECVSENKTRRMRILISILLALFAHAAKAQFTIIPHGINTKFFYPPTNKKFFSDEDFKSNVSCKLLYVSAVEIYKHQWNIIDAVYELRKSGFNFGNKK